MGSKKKIPRKFGQSTGKNKSSRRAKFTGRPKYFLKMKKKPGRLCVQIVNMTRYKKSKKYTFQSSKTVKIYKSFLDVKGLRMRIRKVPITDPKPHGYRLMNLDCLQTHVSEITMHACLCSGAIKFASEGESPLVIQSEVRSMGLASVLSVLCKGCNSTFQLQNSPTLPESKRYDINVRAVWGSIATGNGPSHLNEMMSTMDSPGLSATSFSSIEHQIGNWWLSVLQDSMLEAGAEERRLAIEKGSFHHEVPAITVITDGGWSKRTHKHSYNALGGVAIIIGKETKKLLHIGVRNKYCYICSTANNQKIEPRPHICYKNWDQDSQSMESDIIVEGFKEAEFKHGLRYIGIIGDGDSSVYARIREEVPVWGRDVVKEECANHASKCYRSNLEKLVTDNPLYKGKNNLTKSTRVRLVSAVRSAIRVRSSQVKSNKLKKDAGIKLLRHDITNSVYHVFGHHTKCTDFCKAKETNTSCNTESVTNTVEEHQNTEDSCIFDEQTEYWTEGTSIEAQEEARLGTSVKFDDVEQFILKDVSRILSRIAEKADRLIGNTTTNLAENWMHIRCKFDGGKMYNLCNRGSLHGRCYGGALRMNFGPKWSPTVWESVTGTAPGLFFSQHYDRRHKALVSSTKHKEKKETRAKRWKRKIQSLKNSSTKQAKRSYGPEAMDVSEDVAESELEQLKCTYYDQHVNIPHTQMQNITSSTHDQSLSGIWHTERRKRLTASNFGSVFKRKPSFPVIKLVKNLLYSKFGGNRYTRNGLLQERSTIEEYKIKKAEENINVIVESSGLIIDRINPFLAASPDGIIRTANGDTGLLEIKNLLHSKPLNLFQAADSSSSFCLQNIKGKLKLRKNHNYFYQCHGLLNVCDKEWIDFVVRTQNPYQMYIERIHRDPQLWEHDLLPKLKAFYFNCILPELACPREGKSPGIREPGLWYVPPNAAQTSALKSRGAKSVRKRKRKEDTSTCSEESDAEAVSSRSTRRNGGSIKFVGRRINHEWIIDEANGTTDWYTGTVLSVVSGRDGDLGTTYEVLYDDDEESYEVNHLVEDYRTSSVKFIDL